jgi:hypothetical protein
MAKAPPWKRKNPRRRPATKLTAKYVAIARARAEAAGRRYPNLVDNMYAAKLQAAATKKR